MDKIIGAWAVHEQIAGRIELALGLAVIGFAPFGQVLKGYGFMTESLFAMLLGIAFGAEGIGWFAFHEMNGAREAFFELSRLVIAIQVFNAAVFLDPNYLKKHWGEMARLLVFAMVPMWLASALCVYIVFRYDVLMCLLIGGCMAPTDPVLSSTVVKGRFAEKHLHPVVRESLTAESGANDGLALPFVTLPLLLMKYSAGHAIGVWVYKTILYRVIAAAVVGGCIGAVIALGNSATTKRGLADRDTKLILLIAVSAFTMGVALLIAVDEFVAVFAAGVAFNLLDNETDKEQEKLIDDAVDTLSTFTFFATFGTIIPWNGIARIGTGKLVLLSVLLAVFRRLPFIPLMKPLIFRPYRKLADVVAIGFFGPIGAGAVFWAIYVGDQLEEHNIRDDNDIFDIACFVVVTQAVLYSLSTPIVGRLYDRATGYREQQGARKSVQTQEPASPASIGSLEMTAITIQAESKEES